MNVSKRAISRGAIGGLLVALAFAASVAVAADQKHAEKALQDALAAGNQQGVQAACDELLECNSRDALGALLKVVGKVEGPIYWQVVGAASGFRDRGALEDLGKAIISNQGKGAVSRDLLFGLQNNSSPNVAVPLGLVLEKGKYDLQLMAADQLVGIRAVEAIDALVAALKREEKGDPELRKRIENGLKRLTGEDLGDPGNWDGWWQKQRGSGVPAPKAESGGGGGGGTQSKPRDDEFHGTVEKADPKHIIVLAAAGEAPGDKAEDKDFDYDNMQSVLSSLKIPHRVVKRKLFEEDPDKYLKDCYALLINCHQINKMCVCPKCVPSGDKNNRLMHCSGCNEHIQRTYRLKDEALQKIKKWVEDGGFLYTEDWGLVEVTGVLWPEKVASGTKDSDPNDKGGKIDKPRLIRKAKQNQGGYEEHVIVKLTPSKGSTSHPLMRGVWQKPRKEPAVNAPAEGGAGGTVSREDSPAKPLAHVWQVDDESPAIEIKDKNAVIPLLESDEVGGLADGNTAVAVTFRTGTQAPAPKRQATGPGADAGTPRGTGEWSQNSKAGRVLHTLSHFGHQSGSEDGQALYNLLANFLLEANKHHLESGKKP